MVLNDKTIILINLNSFIIIQKIYCEKFSPIFRNLVVTNCTFYGQFNASILTINGNIFLLDFLKGHVHYKTEDQIDPYYLGNFMKIGSNLAFNNQNKIVCFRLVK